MERFITNKAHRLVRGLHERCDQELPPGSGEVLVVGAHGLDLLSDVVLLALSEVLQQTLADLALYKDGSRMRFHTDCWSTVLATLDRLGGGLLARRGTAIGAPFWQGGREGTLLFNAVCMRPSSGVMLFFLT